MTYKRTKSDSRFKCPWCGGQFCTIRWGRDNPYLTSNLIHKYGYAKVNCRHCGHDFYMTFNKSINKYEFFKFLPKE